MYYTLQTQVFSALGRTKITVHGNSPKKALVVVGQANHWQMTGLKP